MSPSSVFEGWWVVPDIHGMLHLARPSWRLGDVSCHYAKLHPTEKVEQEEKARAWASTDDPLRICPSCAHAVEHPLVQYA